MKLNPILASGALAIAIGLPIVGCAQQSAGQPSMTTHVGHAHRGIMHAFRALNLSDRQKTQIKQIVEQFRSTHPRGSAPDPTARKAMRAQVMSVLTPDQQAQFKASMQRRRANAAHHLQPEATPTPS